MWRVTMNAPDVVRLPADDETVTWEQPLGDGIGAGDDFLIRLPDPEPA